MDYEEDKRDGLLIWEMFCLEMTTQIQAAAVAVAVRVTNRTLEEEELLLQVVWMTGMEITV